MTYKTTKSRAPNLELSNVGCADPRPRAIRVHRLLPLHFPVLLDRARELSGGAGRRSGCSTGSGVYLDLFRYWLKIFAVAFGMGVVSGLVMSYQFGTNWSVFSDKAGPIIGPLMAYEVLTAFFLEAGFLGVMLFGLTKVGPGTAFLRHLHGRARHADVGDLDPERQQLDADARGLCVNADGQFVPAGSGGRSSSIRAFPTASSTP